MRSGRPCDLCESDQPVFTGQRYHFCDLCKTVGELLWAGEVIDAKRIEEYRTTMRRVKRAAERRG
jgi:hypothetical protein